MGVYNSVEESRFIDSMWGLIFGDVYGSFYEFKPPTECSDVDLHDMPKLNVFNLPFGYYTDDSSLALAAMSSFHRKKRFDIHDQMAQLSMYYYRGNYSSTGYCFDIGQTTLSSIGKWLRTGKTENLDWASGEVHSSGNGVLMRMAPFAYWSMMNIEREQEKRLFYRKVCLLTHASPLCIVTATKFGLMLEDLYSGRGIDHYTTLGDNRNSNGFCVGSFNIALDALRNTNSLKEGYEYCIRQGYDTDTNCAIYGQLAGVRYNVNSSGDELFSRLNIKSYGTINRTIRKFLNAAATE